MCPKPLWQPLFSSKHLTNRIVKLDSGMNYFYPSEGLNSDEENSALLDYIKRIEAFLKMRNFEVEALRQLSLQELIDFFDEYVKLGAPQKRTLSVGVYGKLHSS
ncbi:hypothetical protein RIF29_39349 [Crotalaria pallida]|uniref:Uncharacterized protein n=1 Tax=Crotalaria pallida TaxID=3830 RepID=A0AAN9E2Q4_CROPI